MLKKLLFLVCIASFFQCNVHIATGHRAQAYFTNPLLSSGADPWVIYQNNYYYYMQTNGNKLVIWKTKTITQLNNAEKKTVWTPPQNTFYSKEIWAPELHYINSKWYIYFAADDGKNKNHRIYVLENASLDPMQGDWIFKGKVSDATDKWAIDASVFEYKKLWYLIWSGWQGDVNEAQNIYIAKLKNAWTVDGPRVRLSASTFDWEKHGDLHDAENPAHVNVNEGPEILEHKDRLFLVYSASGCWTDFYGLGMLTFIGGSNLLDSAEWRKSPSSVFAGSIKNSVYAPGHNSFFKSPDGKEDWILYHANPQANEGCDGKRSPRAQKFTWNKDGSPNFGEPVSLSEKLAVPSGE